MSVKSFSKYCEIMCIDVKIELYTFVTQSEKKEEEECITACHYYTTWLLRVSISICLH